MIADWLVQQWYRQQPSWPLRLLSPLEWLYRFLLKRRQRAFHDPNAVWQAPVPVIVVGNITLGGVGKTPVVVALAKYLQSQGLKPGIISRGYGGKAEYPQLASADADPKVVGDEPVMMAAQTGCPVMVDPTRTQAAKALLEQYAVDVILADDGLQHYPLGCDFEILVIDGQRGLGNGHCLPVGPLREPEERLLSVDFILINGGTYELSLGQGESERFQLEAISLFDLDGQPNQLSPCRVHGVAGIGNPGRFFQSLRQLGFEVIEHPFPDHHDFSVSELTFADDLPVIMTAKDAVKCRSLAVQRGYYLAVEAKLPTAFLQQFQAWLASKLPQFTQEKPHG